MNIRKIWIYQKHYWTLLKEIGTIIELQPVWRRCSRNRIICPLFLTWSCGSCRFTHTSRWNQRRLLWNNKWYFFLWQQLPIYCLGADGLEILPFWCTSQCHSSWIHSAEINWCERPLMPSTCVYGTKFRKNGGLSLGEAISYAFSIVVVTFIKFRHHFQLLWSLLIGLVLEFVADSDGDSLGGWIHSAFISSTWESCLMSSSCVWDLFSKKYKLPFEWHHHSFLGVDHFRNQEWRWLSKKCQYEDRGVRPFGIISNSDHDRRFLDTCRELLWRFAWWSFWCMDPFNMRWWLSFNYPMVGCNWVSFPMEGCNWVKLRRIRKPVVIFFIFFNTGWVSFD